MKKNFLFGIVLTLAMMFSFTVSAMADAEPAAVIVDEKGDTDKNGTLSFRDALKALLYAAKVEAPTDDDTYRANVDGDDAIDVEDAKIIFNAVIDGKDFGYKYVGEDENVILVSSNSIYWEGENYYTRLSDAVKYVNANAPKSEAERITVLFAPGVYRERTELTAPYITYKAMFPESEAPANITFYYGCGVDYYSLGGVDSGAGTSESSSTTITKSAHDFIAEDMMFENSYNIYVSEEELDDYCDHPSKNHPITIRQDPNQVGVSRYQTQALALTVNADRCKFYNCDIIGRQDTLLMQGNGNRVYFEKCYIEGTVDFIYGNGTAVFESCTINTPYHSGHVTAASHDLSIEYGFLFKDCELTRTPTTIYAMPEDASYSLGRNWHNQSMVCYWNCKMDKHIYEGIEIEEIFDEETGELITRRITDGRWRPMGDQEMITKENSRFSEVGTMDINGNPIELTRDICPEFEDILEQSDMQPGGKYAAYKWLYGSDQWNPGGYPVE